MRLWKEALNTVGIEKHEGSLKECFASRANSLDPDPPNDIC